ncbi:RDD family protein [Actinomadura macrotermitis]|uniref:RDD domain-containing protein n=1 Tax=Actinomadura macrotermitis TaxID=2585200 RepID=A0A7K0BRY6_9ACTN|nr:RDD family protein [Actinomadura macrotermitis]MQY03939.1 hypothetical protein [Actinomadura macrotermitis]
MTQPPRDSEGQPWEPPQENPYGAPPPYPGSPYGGPAAGYADPAEGLAGRWRRLGAAIIDSVIVGAVSALVSLPFPEVVRVVTVDGESDVRYSGPGALVNFLTALAAFLYYVIMHAKRGQTVGKMLLGIRVVRAEDGGAISFGRSAARTAFYYVLSFVTCGIGGLVDVAWILWDPRRQALHDKVARTLVVSAPAGAPDPYAGR